MPHFRGLGTWVNQILGSFPVSTSDLMTTVKKSEAAFLLKSGQPRSGTYSYLNLDLLRGQESLAANHWTHESPKFEKAYRHFES